MPLTFNNALRPGYIFIPIDMGAEASFTARRLGATGFFGKLDPTDINGWVPVTVAEYSEGE